MKQHLIAVDEYLPGIEVINEACINLLSAIAVHIHRMERGAGSVFRRAAECSSVAVMTRTEEIPELVAVQVIVERDREYVLKGILVADKEIIRINRFQDISESMQLVAILYTGLPSVHLDSVHFKGNVLSVRSDSVSPVVVCIYLGIESQLCKKEPCDRLCDSSVVSSYMVASLIGKIWKHSRHLVIDEAHHFASF